MLSYAHGVHAIDIPSHVQKELCLIFAGFDIAHIDDPYLTHVMLVSHLHLLGDQRRTHRGEPEIIMRPAPIGNMVIYAVASDPLFLFRIWEMGDISIIIVTPHQRCTIGHLHPTTVYIQYILIGNNHLWNP